LLKVFAELIIGMDPLENDVIFNKLYQMFWAQGNGLVIMSAISAIDVALWDIKGKYHNVPIYKLLGGKHRDKVRAYASQLQFGWRPETMTYSASTLPKLKESCLRALDDGYDAVKINFVSKNEAGENLRYENLKNYIQPDLMRLFVNRVKTARETLGPDVDIIVENHGLTSAGTTIQFARAIEEMNIMYLEEPTNPLNPHEYRRIADKTCIPLATGERIALRWAFLPLLENRSLSVVQPDLGICGGITEAMKIATLADAYGAKVQIHACNSPISIAASLQVEAALSNFIIHEVHVFNVMPEIVEQGVYDYQPENGYITVPDLPGLGNELSEKALSEATIITINQGRSGKSLI
jgi:L-alanine-DL-glutamate epimerase-like enolase superfamily enzyme